MDISEEDVFIYAGELRNKYTERWGEQFPASCEEVEYLLERGPEAEDVDDYVKAIAEFYSELLDISEVDAQYIQDVYDRTVYNFGLMDLISEINSTETETDLGDIEVNIVSSMPFLQIQTDDEYIEALRKGELDGSYLPEKGRLIISNEKISESKAYSTVAAELFHEFQYNFESESWKHPLLHEGLERATRIEALKHGVAKGIISERQQLGLEVYVAMTGAISLHELNTELLDNGLFKPNIHNWEPEYNIAASSILASEDPDIYSKIFQGEWGMLPEKITQFDN